MSKFTVELDYDAVDSIVLQVLKDQYSGLVDNLEQRKDGRETLGIFLSDKEEDITEIQKHLDSIKIVLSYNMAHTDFEEWKNENL